MKKRLAALFTVLATAGALSLAGGSSASAAPDAEITGCSAGPSPLGVGVEAEDGQGFVANTCDITGLIPIRP